METAEDEGPVAEAAKLLSQLDELGSFWARIRNQERIRTLGERLSDLYLEADDPTKEAIRQLPLLQRRSLQNALLRWTRSCSARILQGLPDASANVRRALAVASIENLRCEWRSTNLALRKVYKKAVAAGLDAQEHFREAAEYSSDQSPHPYIGDHPSMRVFMQNLSKQFLREIGGSDRTAAP